MNALHSLVVSFVRCGEAWEAHAQILNEVKCFKGQTQRWLSSFSSCQNDDLMRLYHCLVEIHTFYIITLKGNGVLTSWVEMKKR